MPTALTPLLRCIAFALMLATIVVAPAFAAPCTTCDDAPAERAAAQPDAPDEDCCAFGECSGCCVPAFALRPWLGDAPMAAAIAPGVPALAVDFLPPALAVAFRPPITN